MRLVGSLVIGIIISYCFVIFSIEYLNDEKLTLPEDSVMFRQQIRINDRYQQRHQNNPASIIQSIQNKLKPRNLKVHENRSSSKKQQMKTTTPQQLFHLHNMKTAGTSFDRKLRCAMRRLEADQNTTVPYYSIHECWRGVFQKCLANSDDPCRRKMKDASVLSFCGPLQHVENLFIHNRQEPPASFTTLRHPVERVWSMYRYQTDNCFNCRNLTDVYKLLDKGEWPMFDNLCMSHLHNKQVTNLMSGSLPANSTDEEKLKSAIHNMKYFFTVVGITEEMNATEKILTTAFPWLETLIDGSDKTCPMEHTNRAPTNNGCIIDRKKRTKYHWYLPPQPDEETRKVILEHNQLDLKLYAAAVEYFQLQKQAIGYEETLVK